MPDFSDFATRVTSAEFRETLIHSWQNPDEIFVQITYILLLVSMLMRDISWLRTFAIAAGAGRVLFQDPVQTFWELILIVVNLTQLALIWWENRKRNYSPATQQFLDTFEPKLGNAAAAALVKAAVWHEAPSGSMLTQQGLPVDALLYVSSGDVRIEVNNKLVGACSTGDFLGEMTWQSGNPATGTAVADTVVKYLRFDRSRLQRLLNQRAELKFALQTSFNRNLVDKLVRSNEAARANAIATAQV